MTELLIIAGLAIYAAYITAYALRQRRHHRKRENSLLSVYEMTIQTMGR